MVCGSVFRVRGVFSNAEKLLSRFWGLTMNAMQDNRFHFLKAISVWSILMLCLGVLPLMAQDPYPKLPDSLNVADTVPVALADTFGFKSKTIRFSNDSLDAPVEYNATDSMVLDNIAKKIYLYGKAFVKYGNISLNAAFIELDLEKNLVSAELREDTLTGKLIGVPEFKDGEQVFTAKRMRYNFKTRKGMVYDVRTTQNDLFVHGSRMKLISEEKKDTSKPDNIIFGQKLLFTTCSAEHPHFGIRSTKQKIIPDKLAIVGPSQIEIMGVPTPIWLPFGFFPLKKGRSTGLLFPRDYEYSESWGFGLRDIGWYVPVGDHLNLALRSNIYFKGTYGLSVQADYRKRYKFSESVTLRFDSQVREDLATGKYGRTKSFGIQFSHNQEAAAHPSARFGGNLNIQGNRNQSRVFNDAYNVLNSQLYSNLNFTKNWPGKPYSLSASFNHSQNLNNRKATINFPNVQFQTQTLYPFKKKVSNDKWYETIALRYAGEGRSSFVATDTTLFTQKMWNDAVTGARHNLDVNTSFKLLKYINVNPNVSYNEVWQLKSIAKSFNSAPIITKRDSIQDPFDLAKKVYRYDTLFGTVNTDTLSGFSSFRQFSAGVSLNTRVFFTLKTGKLTPVRAVRWEMRPNLSFNYSPNYLNPALNYFDSVQYDSRFPLRKQIYSRFDNIAVYGTPNPSGRQMAVGYSLNNIFQAKAYSKRDSIEKKIKLIDNLVIGGNYNFAADSLKWSQISMSTTARFFKGITTMGFFMSLDPYLKNAEGLRYNRTVWQEGKIIPRMETARFSFVTDLTVQKIREMFQGAKQEVVTDVRNQPQPKEADEQDFLSLFENFSISHNLDFYWQAQSTGKAVFKMGTNSINAQGNIELTKNWGVSVGNIGYDFVNKGLSYPSIGFTRDLHCWQLAFNWQPQRGTYVLNIQVKPGSLDFIKIPYQKNNYDSRSGF
jgi:hypothetical protein